MGIYRVFFLCVDLLVFKRRESQVVQRADMRFLKRQSHLSSSWSLFVVLNLREGDRETQTDKLTDKERQTDREVDTR